MKFIWLFLFSLILFACSKQGSDNTSQQNGRLPRKALYYLNGDADLSETLLFNYDSIANTVVVNSIIDNHPLPETLYSYNTDSFLTRYQCYDRLYYEFFMERAIVIKRDQGNKILSMYTSLDAFNYPSDTADFSYEYNGIYSVVTVIEHGHLSDLQNSDIYRLDTSVYRYIDSSHQLVSVDRGQRDDYLGYTTTHTAFSYEADGRIDSAVTTVHYNLDFGPDYVGTETTKWVRKYLYQPGVVPIGAHDYFKERLLGKDYYLAPLADLFYYNEKYRTPYQFVDLTLRMTPEPYVSRTAPFHVSSIEVTRTSDVFDLYSMPAKQVFNYSYTIGFNGQMDGYRCDLTADGTVSPQRKVVFEY